VNVSEQPITATFLLNGFTPRQPIAKVETLAGGLEDRNTADNPELIRPILNGWQHGLNNGHTSYTYPARSFTVLRFE
jgi:hypothetical protein